MKTMNTMDLIALLKEVATDYQDEGCEGCGTISVTTINKVREALGWELLDTLEYDALEGID